MSTEPGPRPTTAEGHGRWSRSPTTATATVGRSRSPEPEPGHGRGHDMRIRTEFMHSRAHTARATHSPTNFPLSTQPPDPTTNRECGPTQGILVDGEEVELPPPGSAPLTYDDQGFSSSRYSTSVCWTTC
jgi:hypothetical protein